MIFVFMCFYVLNSYQMDFFNSLVICVCAFILYLFVSHLKVVCEQAAYFKFANIRKDEDACSWLLCGAGGGAEGSGSCSC